VFFSFAFPGGFPPKTPGLSGWWAPNHTALEPAAARDRTWSFGLCLDGLVKVEREPGNHDCTAVRAVGVGVRPEPVVDVRGRAVSSSLDHAHSARLTIATQPRSASLGRGSLTSTKDGTSLATCILAFVPIPMSGLGTKPAQRSGRLGRTCSAHPPAPKRPRSTCPIDRHPRRRTSRQLESRPLGNGSITAPS